MKFKIKEKKLENGLSIIYTKVQSNDISIIATIKAGPIYEPDNLIGISHFCEHVMFKGTKKRKSPYEIFSEFKFLGDKQFSETDENGVTFKTTVITEDFNQTLDIITDILYCAKMEDKDIEEEKGVVMDELRDRHDDPELCVGDKFEEVLFKDSQLSKFTAEKEETVMSLKPRDVKEFYKSYFVPSNTTIFIVGPLDFEETLDKVKHYFPIQRKAVKIKEPKIKNPVNKKRDVVIKKELEDAYNFSGKIVTGTDYSLEILTSSLSMAIYNRLFGQEHISYTAYADYRACGPIEYIFTYATYHPSNHKKVRKAITEELKRFQKGDIPEGYVIDSIVSEKKAFILENNQTMGVCQTLFDFWLGGDVHSINRYLKDLESCTFKEIKRIASKYISTDDLTTVILGNIQNEEI